MLVGATGRFDSCVSSKNKGLTECGMLVIAGSAESGAVPVLASTLAGTKLPVGFRKYIPLVNGK